MSHLIFSRFPTGLLGKLRPVALEAAKVFESVMVLSSHPGLPEASVFEVRAVWELELRTALGSCFQGQNCHHTCAGCTSQAAANTHLPLFQAFFA